MSATKSQIQEFGKDFSAKTGKVLEDTEESINALFDPTKPSTTSRILGGLKAINEPVSPEDITAEVFMSGAVKIGFPKSVRDFPEKIIDTLDTFLVALETLKDILITIRDLIVGLSDLLKTLLEAIFEQIENLIDMLTSVDAKVRVLPIPPIHPSNIKAENFTVADSLVAAAFGELIIGAYGETNVSNQFALLDRDQIETRLLGEVGPTAAYKDGSSGFLKAINNSFDDKQDPNRPIEKVGFSGGFVIHAGAPTQIITDTYEKIKALLLGDLAPPAIDRKFSARVRIQSIQQIGFNENNKPLLALSMANPEKLTPKNLLDTPKELYLPTRIDVLFVEDTGTSKYPLIQEAGYINLSTFRGITNTTDLKSTVSIFSAYTKEFKNTVNLKSFSSIGITRFYEDSLDLEIFLDNPHMYSIPHGATLKSLSALIKCRVRFKKFNLNGSTYEEDTTITNVDDPSLVVISNTMPIYITTDPDESWLPVVPTGPAPNWIQYGKKLQLPGTDAIKRFFRKLLKDLKSLLDAATNILVSVVNTFILLVERMSLLIMRLQNIVYEIDKLLDLEIGANFIAFYSDNGVSGIKKAINDHYNEQKRLFDAARAEGKDTKDMDWFASGESVCGAVIVCTSEAAEKINRLLSLLSMLLGGEDSKDSSAQSLFEVGATSGPKELPFDATPTNPSNLFTEDFTGTGDHLLSPENVCP